MIWRDVSALTSRRPFTRLALIVVLCLACTAAPCKYAPHLTIRTSFFGRSPRGDGLVDWAIAQRGRSIEGFLDYRFTGLSAALLADLVVAAIGARAPLEGVCHVGGEPVTKHELLAAIGQELHLDLRVVPVGRGKVDRTLNADRFFAALGRQRPTLAESVATLGSCGVLSRS